MFRPLAPALSLLMLSSCATVLADHNRSIMITSSPPGAKITVNGEPRGETPSRVRVSDHETLSVAISKDGYHSGGCLVNTSIETLWLVGDLILITLIVPIVVDLVTNNWSSLESAYCTVKLTPRKTEPSPNMRPL